MKNLIYTLLIIVLFSSCGEYQKVLNKGESVDRYKLAVELYEEQEYNKAIQLFEKLVTPYAGKPQMERIQYMTADSYYNTKSYESAAYYYSKFIANYPESSKIEEAAFLIAKSYYLNSPKYSLDQQETQKALAAFQSFIDTYPTSDLVVEANKAYLELTTRLEKKDFEVAKQYYHTEYYSAAITAFTAFTEEHIGSVLKEDALYYRFKSNYELGMNSIMSKKEDRLLNAKIAYSKFKKSFPESKKMKELDGMIKQMDEELAKLKEEISTISQNKN